MVTKSLKENSIFKLLEANPSSDSTAYQGVLLLVEPEVDEALEFTKTIFPSFTSHGLSHSLRVLEHIYKILSNDLRTSLTPPELFCLIMAALFHDMGMSDPTVPDRYEQRKNHHLYVERPLKDFMNEKLCLIKERNRLFNCILFVCQAHGMALDAFYGDQRFYMDDTIGDYVLRFGLLGSLLRIGDLLDLDENRTSNFIRRFYPSYFSDDALPHHERHEQIERYSLSPEYIYVTVQAKNIEEYHIWEGWFHYLNEDILHANTYLLPRLCKDFHFPALSYTIQKAPGSNYQTEEMRFELTDEGAIWNILSQSVYTEEYDFIRELVQNGIDAILMRSYRDPAATLPSPSPRSWNMWKKPGKVVVAYSEHDSSLIISDTGTGMDFNAVKSFLFRIADSGYRHQKTDRSFPFPSIAKFGIGFISCLSKCEEITLFTQASNNAPGYKVRLFSNSIRAYYEEINPAEDCGTTICMKLKRHYQTEDVEAYLTRTFPYPSVPVEWLDLDTMEEAIPRLCECGALSKRPDFDFFYIMPYLKFAACYESFEKARNQIYSECDRQIELLQEKQDSLKDALNHWKGLENLNKLEKTEFEGELIFLMRNLKGKELLADTQKMLSHFLKESQKYTKSKFKLVISDILDGISTCIDNLFLDKSKIQNQQSLFDSPKSLIGNAVMRSLLRKPAVAICLSEDFDIVDVAIERSGQSQSLCSNCGFLLVYCAFDDWETGIEWRSLHGFLFNHGLLTNSLTSKWTETRGNSSTDTISLSWLSSLEEEYSYEDILEDQTDGRIFEYYKDDVIVTHFSKLLLSRSAITLFSETEEESYSSLEDRVERSSEREPDRDYIKVLSNSWDQSPYCKEENPFSRIRETDNIFSQDGIKIEFDPSKIVPLGLCKAQINLSANARLDLNIGRRYIDESQGKIDSWLANTGNHIQTEVSKQLIAAIESYGLAWEPDALCGESEYEDYFEHQSNMQIRQTLKKLAKKKIEVL